MKLFAKLMLLATMLVVAPGCAPGDIRAGNAMRLLLSPRSAIDDTPLSPQLRYLRVSSGGRSALLVLGYVTPTEQGPVQTWYSQYGEVIKLLSGRIVGTAGLSTDWREVRFYGLPSWSAIPDVPARAVREHDEMPGYRMGIRESIEINRIAAPADSKFIGDPKRLQWFEERSDSSGLAPSRYAVNMRDAQGETVVYGEQCLAEKVCLTWQTWPAADMN